MSTRFNAGAQVTILNNHGNRKGIIVEWDPNFRMWAVRIISGVGKGETQLFLEQYLKGK